MSNAEAYPQQNWTRRFFTIWVGQAFSLFGSSLVQFSLVWYMTQKTGSATVLATGAMIAMLPQVILGAFIGALVDRWNRRLILIIADSSIALASMVLIILFATDKVQIWHIYGIILIRAVGEAFHSPAMAASTPLMVPKEHLPRVAGANQTLQGLMGIFAPPLGAVLVSYFSTEYILAIDVVTASIAVIPLLFIAIPLPPRQAEPQNPANQKSYWHDLLDGFRYVKKWPGLLALILMAMLLNFLLIPSSSLAPIVVTSIFGKGAADLAWTETIFGVGIILGGITLSIWGGFKKKIVTSLSGIIGLGVGVMLIGIAPVDMFYLVLAGNFIIGFTQVMANGPISAIFQSTIDPDMLGRVLSLIRTGATAMMPLSLLVAGPISDAFGPRLWYVTGGALCILVVLFCTFIPSIMNIESNNSGVTKIDTTPPVTT